MTRVLLERLATIDLDDGTGDDDPEGAHARAEAVELRARLAAAVEQFTDGKLSAATLAKIEAKLEPQIGAADRAARGRVVSPLVRELAGENVETRWDALSVEQRRDVVRALVDVTVLPSKRPPGARGFDPKAVKIEWRNP